MIFKLDLKYAMNTFLSVLAVAISAFAYLENIRVSHTSRAILSHYLLTEDSVGMPDKLYTWVSLSNSGNRPVIVQGISLGIVNGSDGCESLLNDSSDNFFQDAYASNDIDDTGFGPVAVPAGSINIYDIQFRDVKSMLNDSHVEACIKIMAYDTEGTHYECVGSLGSFKDGRKASGFEFSPMPMRFVE